ncbi:hypothetical protein COEREDRAFT_94639 [Coemansia reversa NRRL 1564]|uniref:Uncharacterized protein n=1 Tax=Coemansia reversa (strain ATCC 12441 / NRRL 1564) TaxID=763665 RepID=A0A2G5B2T6_COERN|nr:hypothetical protein COEREDRAFT_94639 [Coemansia reversa NRRL 1564]|eukprot:PIA13330.1 hypothetical protein COEREDRAFT_94639 [Coemansia reversa NRRL 1564]
MFRQDYQANHWQRKKEEGVLLDSSLVRANIWSRTPRAVTWPTSALGEQRLASY